MGVKKRWVILGMMTCLITGLNRHITMNTSMNQATAYASSSLEEQIKQYEESLTNEENTFIPYSQTSQTNSSPSSSVVSQTTETTIKKQVNGVAHNNISRLGQGVGDALKTVVREVLRSLIKMIDQLISES